jgi:hypothetical protein
MCEKSEGERKIDRFDDTSLAFSAYEIIVSLPDPKGQIYRKKITRDT